MLDRNVVFPSVMIVLSVIAFFIIGQFDDAPMYQEASVDAKSFPRAIVIGQIILCIGLLIQHKKSPPRISDAAPIFSKLSVLGLIFLCSYAVLINLLGYLIASLIAFIAYLSYFRVKKPVFYLVAVAFVFCLYFIFGKVFYIALPEGLLF